MTIEEILSQETGAEAKITALKEKTINVPLWGGSKGLIYEFDPKKHPVMNRGKYPDIITSDGVQPVTRVTLDLQRLAAKRMTELIQIKRVYSPRNDRQQEVAEYLEKIYTRTRIQSVNTERLFMLFAGCEVMTLWYAVSEENNLYGFKSPLKMRCRNFSPMLGDELYPFFDEYGDMIAMSVGYTRKVGRKSVQFFDTYTASQHVKWSTQNGAWEEIENETISVGKIPAIYMYRPTPIWEDASKIVYEMEWALSRNGNYLRENSKPLFVVFSDEVINYGDEKSPNKEFRAVMQYPKGSTAQYITWNQAVDNLKYYTDTLRSLFFTQLQLPDWSYEKMSQVALSGESRKQLFIDAQLKVQDESGRILEFLEREMNVVKAFAKIALGNAYADDIEALSVETQITPFSITDEADTIKNLMTANGNEPIISQREAIQQLGWSDDVDRTMNEIQQQKMTDALNLAE